MERDGWLGCACEAQDRLGPDLGTRLTLARNIAAITLLIWKKGVRSNRESGQFFREGVSMAIRFRWVPGVDMRADRLAEESARSVALPNSKLKVPCQ